VEFSYTSLPEIVTERSIQFMDAVDVEIRQGRVDRRKRIA
jgi:hypothetical protein